MLGHNVLQLLLDAGHEVKSMVRDERTIRIESPHNMVLEGLLTDPDCVWATAKENDAIINCTGVTDMSLPRRKDYEAVNVEACRSIVKAMERTGIKRLVHVSTVNTIGYGTADHPADENEAIKAPFDKSYYADSKLCGENIILEAAAKHPDWHVVVVNPGFMIGPMDVKPSSGRLLLTGYRRSTMYAPQGGKAFVDVRDVATAVVNALTMGHSGERYIAVNHAGHLTIKELYELQARVMGYQQRVKTLPDGLLRVAGWLGDGVRSLGIRCELSTCNVEQLMVREYYDNSRAINELAMPETDLSQSIRDFHQWREENGKKENRSENGK